MGHPLMPTGGRGRRWVALGGLVVILAVPVAGSAQGMSEGPRGDARLQAPATDWVQISAGYDHTCGLRSTGRLYCWGSDSKGQLGDGLPDADQTMPVEVTGGATNWVQV